MIAEYDKALKANPKYDYAYVSKGLSLHNLGRYEEAIAEDDKALTITPNNTRALNNKQLALKEIG